MKKPLKIFFPILLVIFLVVSQVKVSHAQTPTPQQHVIIYLFWKEGCSHCAKAKPYFENLAADYPEIQLRTYEVYYDAEN